MRDIEAGKGNRDVLLGAAAGFIIDNDAAMRSFRDWSAAFVPVFAVLLSALGFVNGRRCAAVRSVDIPIAGLPAALHGFTIAQITDLHVGPTIRDHADSFAAEVSPRSPVFI